MQIRTGYLGAYQLGGLHGFKFAYDELCKEHSHIASDLDIIFYSAVFQAGIDRFLIDDCLKGKVNPVGADRINILKAEEFARYCAPVMFFFREELLHKKSDKRNLEIWKIAHFLMELYVCMGTNSCRINTLPSPSIEPLRASQYDALYQPLALIINQLAPHATPTPTLACALSKDSLRRLEDIMTGKLFVGVKTAHNDLQDPNVKIKTSLLKIKSESTRLVLRHPGLLQLSSAGLSLLRATPKLIDLAFGKLAGVLGEATLNTTEKFFKREKNIAIYHSGEIIQNQLQFVINEIKKNRRKKV